MAAGAGAVSGLAHLFPVPEPVSLGRWAGSAICFRLRDLAHLEVLERALAGGDPLAGRRWPLVAAKAAASGDCRGEAPAARAYAAVLREAIGAVRDAGGSGDRGLLATAAGKLLWLDTLLSRTNPGFTAGTAAGILADATVTRDQFMHVESVAYADAPADWIRRLLVPPPRRRGGPGGTWADRIREVMEARGWTFEQVGDLFLSQWLALGGHEPGKLVKTKENAGWYRAVTELERWLVAPQVGRNGRGH